MLMRLATCTVARSQQICKADHTFLQIKPWRRISGLLDVNC